LLVHRDVVPTNNIHYHFAKKLVHRCPHDKCLRGDRPRQIPGQDDRRTFVPWLLAVGETIAVSPKRFTPNPSCAFLSLEPNPTNRTDLKRGRLNVEGPAIFAAFMFVRPSPLRSAGEIVYVVVLLRVSWMALDGAVDTKLGRAASSWLVPKRILVGCNDPAQCPAVKIRRSLIKTPEQKYWLSSPMRTQFGNVEGERPGLRRSSSRLCLVENIEHVQLEVGIPKNAFIRLIGPLESIP